MNLQFEKVRLSYSIAVPVRIHQEHIELFRYSSNVFTKDEYPVQIALDVICILLSRVVGHANCESPAL